jgi:IclR family pca regulon transcriptional regulator
MDRQPGDAFVQSLARGLDVITAFDAEHGSMTLSQVAVRAGLSRATARRLLLTLVELGYVRLEGKQFTLAPQVLRLGTAYLSGMGLPDVAQPHLERLSALAGESTSAAVLDGTEIVYVARVATRRLMRVGITVGTRFPAYATSMGRVLLAALPPAESDERLAASDLVALTPHTVVGVEALRTLLDGVRRHGWSLVDQELETGLRSLAVPVRDAAGAVVGAVNLSMSASSPDGGALAQLPALLETAAAIGADLALTDR